MISRMVRPAVAGLLMFSLTSCGDDSPDAEPSPVATSADSGSPTPTTPSVVPATGKQIGAESVRMRLTASPDWKISQFGTTVAAGLFVDGAGIVNAIVGDIIAGPGLDTEDKAVSYERSLAGTPLPPTRVADRTIDGTNCFVLEARTKEGHRYIVGGVTEGRFFNVEFVVPAQVPDGDQLIEQMLATVEIGR